MTAAAPARRTQRARREGTIRKLLDAATDTLIELGYARASVQAVCLRAGVSQGGLFRHFSSREALMVAVGLDVGQRLLDDFRRTFAAQRDAEEPIGLALRLLRDQTRSRLNQAWYELAIAARTHESLRAPLAEAAAAYHASIERVARDVLPEVAAALGDDFGVLVDTAVSVFDGENVHRFVFDRPDVEERRIALLTTAVRTLAQKP